MFKVNSSNTKTRMKNKESARRRQIVYSTILGNPGSRYTAKQLAAAAGFDVSVVNSKEYRAGISFIDNMQRSGYISHNIPTSREGNEWFVQCKEKVDCEHFLKNVEPTNNGIDDRSDPNHLILNRSVEVNEENNSNGEVKVKIEKKSNKVTLNKEKKFDIVLTIYESETEDPNNASVELEGKTTSEIVDAIRALTAIL